jgi:hypothetical protein
MAPPLYNRVLSFGIEGILSQLLTTLVNKTQMKKKVIIALKPGLWSRYTKAPTPTPRFLKLRLRPLHKSPICINDGKPIRHFIATA